jgi:hypothetical protein
MPGAGTTHRTERARNEAPLVLHGLDHIQDGDLGRRSNQEMAAIRPTPRLDEPRRRQGSHDLRQIPPGHLRPGRDPMGRRRSPGLTRQVDHRPQGVFGRQRDHFMPRDRL